MNQGDNSALAAMAERECNILPHDGDQSIELKKVSDYVAEKSTEVKELSDKVRDIGFLGLFWDSQIPKKDKTFYYFFSLKVSDRVAVLEEIGKYLDFYKKLGDAVCNINNAEEMTDKAAIIESLKKQLLEMNEAAKCGENNTDSSTVCHLHRSFIQKHEMLEYMIKRVECDALKNRLEKAEDGWKKSLQKIEELQKEFRDAKEREENRDIERKREIDALKQQNEQLQKNHQELNETNRKLAQLIEVLLEENREIKTTLRRMPESIST